MPERAWTIHKLNSDTEHTIMELPANPHNADTTVQLSEILKGMQPAFRHCRTGESHLAQLEAGVPAAVYGFAGLPDDWIVERDVNGNATALHPDVMAGYWRDARFIALEHLSSLPLDG